MVSDSKRRKHSGKIKNYLEKSVWTSYGEQSGDNKEK